MPAETITASERKGRVAESALPVVVNFGAVRCGFCTLLKP